MNKPSNGVSYEFGIFRVDTLKRRLLRGSAPCPLTARAFDTLAVLLAHRGETVSKAELMSSVWGDTAVEENNLTQQISAIRKALGERAGDHEFIVTIPGRGYSFVAPIREFRAEAIAGPKITEPASLPIVHKTSVFDPDSLFGAGLAIAYVVVVCLAVLLSGSQNPERTKPQSIAILNFSMLDGEDERLGVGIRDTLRAKLGSMEDIAVRPDSLSAPPRGILEAGRRMHVDVVLAGSIQRDQDRVRVTVEMVDVTGERITWGKTFDERLTNLFELQDSIAAEVAQALRKAQIPGRRSRLEKSYDEADGVRAYFVHRRSVFEPAARSI